MEKLVKHVMPSGDSIPIDLDKNQHEISVIYSTSVVWYLGFSISLVCLMMLQPLVLEYGLLSKENQKNFKLIMTEIYLNLKQTLTEMSATARQSATAARQQR